MLHSTDREVATVASAMAGETTAQPESAADLMLIRREGFPAVASASRQVTSSEYGSYHLALASFK